MKTVVYQNLGFIVSSIIYDNIVLTKINNSIASIQHFTKSGFKLRDTPKVSYSVSEILTFRMADGNGYG